MRDSLDEKLNFQRKSRIVGCKKQLESFSFFFGLNLGQKLYAHTENLSRTLQQKKMSAVKRKELTDPRWTVPQTDNSPKGQSSPKDSSSNGQFSESTFPRWTVP